MTSGNTRPFGLPFVYSGEVFAAGIVFPIIGILLTMARFYSRRTQKQPLLADDWLLLPALICLSAMGGILIAGAAKGVMGYPTPSLPENYDQLTDVTSSQALIEQLEYLFWLFLILTFGFIKLTVLFLYRRIFVVGKTVFGLVIWCWIGFSILWTITFALAQILACGRHPSLYWGPFENLVTQCTYGLNFLLALAITDIISDVFIFFLPFPLIWRLQMSTKKKLLSTGVLLIGSMSLVAAAIRLSLNVSSIKAGYATKIDVNLNLTLVFWWGMVEAGIAVIAVNLPILHHFVGMRTVQSIIGSARSVISLGSRRSNSSQSKARDRGLEAPAQPAEPFDGNAVLLGASGIELVTRKNGSRGDESSV